MTFENKKINNQFFNQEKEQKIAKLNGKIKVINNILESLKKEYDIYENKGDFEFPIFS